VTTNNRRVRQLHWRAIPRNKAQSTFWGKLENIDLSNPDGMEIEPKDLEKEVTGLFSLSPEKTTPLSARALKSTGIKFVPKHKINLLDVKKSNNIGILLSQFKISYVAIKQAIIEMDPILTKDLLISLKYMFPLTDEEKTLYEEYHGDKDILSSADLFYLELLPVPRLEQKINSLLFKNQFDEQVEVMLETASILQNASEELQSSQQFAKILKWIFTIGSFLTKATRSSDTVGFSLDSLPKIIQTKTGEGKQNFIDYLVSKIEDRNPEILHFEEELPHLEQASKVSIEILNLHKKETESELNELSKEITFYEQSQNTFNESDQFLNVMKPFLSYAEKKLSEVTLALEAAINSFQSTVDYFGDDQKVATPNSFFSNVVSFAHAFRRSHHLSIEKKLRMESLKLKESKRLQITAKSTQEIPNIF
jgi:diaphanous 3